MAAQFQLEVVPVPSPGTVQTSQAPWTRLAAFLLICADVAARVFRIAKWGTRSAGRDRRHRDGVSFSNLKLELLELLSCSICMMAWGPTSIDAQVSGSAKQLEQAVEVKIAWGPSGCLGGTLTLTLPLPLFPLMPVSTYLARML